MWPIQHLTNCLIYNFTFSNHHFHISTFTLQTWQVYIILRAAQTVWTVLKNIHWVAQFFFKVFFAQTLSFWAVFFGGGWGAWISGLLSYLLGYILTNLHTHLLRLPMHLPTYLPRCRPLSSPTYNLGYQLMTKFASMQVYKFAGLQIYKTYKLQINNYNLQLKKLQVCMFASLQVCKF